MLDRIRGLDRAVNMTPGALLDAVDVEVAEAPYSTTLRSKPPLCSARQDDINQRSDLKVPQGHMFSEWSDVDPVPHRDIANNFGAFFYQGISAGTLSDIQQLSTGDSAGADGPHHITHEHGQYLDNNSTSQDNTASVVAGRPDLAVRYVQP
jgi:hypothetical protein